MRFVCSFFFTFRSNVEYQNRRGDERREKAKNSGKENLNFIHERHLSYVYIAGILAGVYECEFKIDAHDLDKSLSRNVYY